MMYHHHGINFNFTGSYGEYFTTATNVDAVVYLMLANMLVHELLPEVSTVILSAAYDDSLDYPEKHGGIMIRCVPLWFLALGASSKVCPPFQLVHLNKNMI